MQNGAPFLREDGRRPESPDQRVDAERELPDDLGDRRDALHRPACLEQAEQHADARKGLDRAADHAQQRESPGHQAGPEHEVAQDQPVPDPDDEAGPELERPVLDRGERLGVPAHHRGIRARVLPQRHDCEDGEDADEEEDAFHDASCDVAERENLVSGRS